MKKKKRKKKNKSKKLLLICLCIIGIYYFINNESFLKTVSYENYGIVNYYAIYGTHMNIKGTFKKPNNIDKVSLVLTNGKKEISLPCNFKDNTFETSAYINDGINLETLNTGKYYLMFKGTYNKTSFKYYSVKNDTKYNNLVYYTLTKNNKNNKININWDKFNNNSILVFNIENTELPDNVYDITIDPGHDATDSGMMVCSSGVEPSSSGKCSSGTLYKESDLNLQLSKELKKQLENLGYKVIMTRNTSKDTVSTYGTMGSATTANDTKSKFNLVIHHNSSGITGGVSSLKGLELYVANDITFDLSDSFVKNITKYAETTVSTKKIFLVHNGIYQRFFTKDEIKQDKNKTTNTIYYYSIREVGGISTHAYNDGSYSKYGKNKYYNSNNTAESYLFELGYMDNVSNLKNILNNKKGYAKGIALGLQNYLSS